MTIVPIHFTDPATLKEVQDWLNANTSATIATAFIQGNYFYIVTNP